jgi:hypothetical protein
MSMMSHAMGGPGSRIYKPSSNGSPS